MQVFFFETRGLKRTAFRGNGKLHQIASGYFGIGHSPIWTINFVGIIV